MRNTARAVVVTILALFGVVVMGTSGTTPTMSASVQLLASYALKGTQVPVFNITSDQAIEDLAVQYGGNHGVTDPGVVDYPASWRPFSPGGFSSATWDQSVRAGVLALQTDTAGDATPVVIFGYSQGAVVGSEFKKAWNTNNPAPGTYPHPTFVFIGNGDRPNGGAMARFPGIYIPGLDMTTTGATPTETAGSDPDEITTVDIAGQYDPIADLPTNPGNLVASMNSAMALFYVHLNYANLTTTPVLQDEYGDTAYYLIPTYPVPLLMPVQMIPIVGPIAADMLDPLVRLMVEAGYNRTISPGQPTTADFGYFPNPIAFAGNIPLAIKTGLDNGLQDIGAGRVLNTSRPDIGPGSTGQGAYGIGGPLVTKSPTTNATPMMLASPAVARIDPDASAPEVNTQPQQPAVTETTSNSTNRGPRLNVLRLPLFAVPGQTETVGGSNSSQPKPATPVKSALSGVTTSIKAVATSIKNAVNSLKPKKEAAATADAPAG